MMHFVKHDERWISNWSVGSGGVEIIISVLLWCTLLLICKMRELSNIYKIIFWITCFGVKMREISNICKIILSITYFGVKMRETSNICKFKSSMTYFVLLIICYLDSQILLHSVGCEKMLTMTNLGVRRKRGGREWHLIWNQRWH